MSVFRVILSIIFPPLAVLDRGCGSVLIVLILTCAGWILNRGQILVQPVLYRVLNDRLKRQQRDMLLCVRAPLKMV